MPSDLIEQAKLWILWLIVRAPAACTAESISKSAPSHIQGGAIPTALQQLQSENLILISSGGSIALTVAGVMFTRLQGMPGLLALSERSQLLYDNTANYVYEDLNRLVAQLREELACNGMSKSSVFVRRVADLVFDRLCSLYELYQKSFIATFSSSTQGITAFREDWLRTNIQSSWEIELSRARGVASSYAQATGFTAQEVNSLTESVVIQGRQQIMKQLLNSVRIAAIDSLARYDAAMTINENLLKFAENSYLSRRDVAHHAYTDRMKNTVGALGYMNVRTSTQTAAEIESEHIAELLLAKKESTLEALKRFNQPLDSEIASTLNKEVTALAETLISGMSGRLRHESEMLVKRTNTDPEPLRAKTAEIMRDVQRRVTTALNKIHREIENEQLSPTPVPARDASQSHTTNIYNLHGTHSRVNIESTDQSVNISNVTPAELFETMRQVFESRVQQEGDRAVLLQRVAELEASSNNSGNFASAYQRFISSAADYMTLITPFLPALTQLLTSHHV